MASALEPGYHTPVPRPLLIMIRRRRNPLVQIILIALVACWVSAPAATHTCCQDSSPLTPGTRSGRWRHFSGSGWFFPEHRLGRLPAWRWLSRSPSNQPVISRPLDRLDPPDNLGRADPGLRVPLERPCLLRRGSRLGRYDRRWDKCPQGEAELNIHGAFSCH